MKSMTAACPVPTRWNGACVAVLVALLVGRAAWAVDMPNYRKHITKFHQLLEKAQRARSKGDLKEADKLAAKADEEKALADVALNSPPKLLKINEPGPVVNYEGPYYGGYRGWGWNRRDPWWGYPYRRW